VKHRFLDNLDLLEKEAVLGLCLRGVQTVFPTCSPGPKQTSGADSQTKYQTVDSITVFHPTSARKEGNTDPLRRASLSRCQMY